MEEELYFGIFLIIWICLFVATGLYHAFNACNEPDDPKKADQPPSYEEGTDDKNLPTYKEAMEKWNKVMKRYKN